jgi:hypothetical protein
MEELEQSVKEKVLDKEITDIKVFNVDDSYSEFVPDSQWVVDGGIQIEFGNQFICVGWNFVNAGFDFSLSKTADQILGEAPYYQINLQKMKGLADFVGSRIRDIKFKWEFYQELDEEGKPKQEKVYTPVELLLEFDYNAFLQIAEIEFRINPKVFEISTAKFNIFGQLLLSVNKRIEINEY